MEEQEIKDTINWYIECKEASEKIESLYRVWLDIQLLKYRKT